MEGVKKLVQGAKGHVPEAAILAPGRAPVLVLHVLEHAVEHVRDVPVVLPILERVKIPVTAVQGVHLVLERVKVLAKELVNRAVLRVVNQDVKNLVFQPVLRLA